MDEELDVDHDDREAFGPPQYAEASIDPYLDVGGTSSPDHPTVEVSVDPRAFANPLPASILEIHAPGRPNSLLVLDRWLISDV